METRKRQQKKFSKFVILTFLTSRLSTAVFMPISTHSTMANAANDEEFEITAKNFQKVTENHEKVEFEFVCYCSVC